MCIPDGVSRLRYKNEIPNLSPKWGKGAAVAFVFWILFVCCFGFRGELLGVGFCLRCWVSDCSFLGMDVLRARFNVNFVEFFFASPHSPFWRYIVSCRVAVQKTTLHFRGGVCWVDVVVRLVLGRLVVLVRLLELSVVFCSWKYGLVRRYTPSLS